MFDLTLSRFEALIAERRDAGAVGRLAVPVFRYRNADLVTPVSAYLSLREVGGYGFLLESVEGGTQLGRHSFIGRRPYLVVESRGAVTRLRRPHVGLDGGEIEITSSNIFEVLARIVAEVEEVKLPELPPFTGGAVGMIGYDSVRLLEDLPSPPPDDLDTPDALWAFYDTVAAFDHVTHRLALIATAFIDPGDDAPSAYAGAQERLDELERSLHGGPAMGQGDVALNPGATVSTHDRAAFTGIVERAKQYITEGDIFQVVLSQRFSVPFEGDAFLLYRALRQANPSPYLFFLDFEDGLGRALVLCGSSPESLVRVREGRAEVLPIAGTRPRGASSGQDEDLAADLVADEKEQAEHLMLVDLGRNDLGRSCRPGSVRVDRFADVERFARVMHLVSSVSGDVREDREGLDVVAACFPAGTVTGAPKVRAMEIIDELEPVRRGVYAGAVGYVDFSGNTDTCITIRTMLIRRDSPQSPDGTIYVQAGAGIVADSDPDLEFTETQNKAHALFDALRHAASGLA
jgi:anthranilate synthase component I